MRILQVVPSYLPAIRYGGPIYSVHGLSSALAKRGHDVHVFATNVDGPGASSVRLQEPVEVDGVKVWYFRCGLGRRFFRSPAMGQALATHVSSFDVLHLHSAFLWPTLAAARAARVKNVPYVFAPHGMLVRDLIRHKSRVAKMLWITLFERKTISAAAALHLTSELEKTEIEKFRLHIRRVVVIASGIDLPDQVSVGPGQKVGGRPFVLSLGRVNWKKGLDRLIRAMPYVHGADLVIAGNDEERYVPSLERLVKKLGLSARVRFVGAVYGQEKWTLMQSASVFALPSYSENFGIAALEAMACATPVVVTPEVGLAAAVAATGAGLVIDGDPEQLGRAISDLLVDDGRRALIGAAGRRAVEEKFLWSSIAEQMEIVYRGILDTAARDA
jgi:glycosyltransferase involved in cell wall biosynthesis